MRVFVTGASGFVGSAVVRELIGAGHQVLGLARSDEAAKTVAAAGAEVHRGSLEDIDSLKTGAAKSDGVAHLGFNHDFSKFAENGQMDKRAIEAMGEVLAGSNRPLIVTSGTAMIAPGQVATEDMRRPDDDGMPRVSEQTADAIAKRHGVRSMAIRLAPAVHGKSEQGFKAGFGSALIQIARDKGVSAYIGDGRNRWTTVHRLDAARLYRLALEKGTVGAIYHGVGEEDVPVKDIATAIGKRFGLPVVSKPQEEAMNHFGFYGMFVGIDMPAANAKTKQQLGWQPKEIGLIPGIQKAQSFASG
jgi:nucleoside-diphosphate-sugar epimerase